MKAKAIWIDTEIGKKGLHMVDVDEAVDLIPCLINYLCDGIRPEGKSAAFMDAFEYMLQGAEIVSEED